MTPLEKLGTDILNPDKKWEDALKEWVEDEKGWDKYTKDNSDDDDD